MAAFELRNQKGPPVTSSSKAGGLTHFPLTMDACSRAIRSIASVSSSASLFDDSAEALFECHEADLVVELETQDDEDAMSAYSTTLKASVASPYRSFILDPSLRFKDHPSQAKSRIIPFRYGHDFLLSYCVCDKSAVSATLFLCTTSQDQSLVNNFPSSANLTARAHGKRPVPVRLQSPHLQSQGHRR